MPEAHREIESPIKESMKKNVRDERGEGIGVNCVAFLIF